MKEQTEREIEIRSEIEAMAIDWKESNTKRAELEKELRDLVKDRLDDEFNGKCYAHENEQDGDTFIVYIRIIEYANEAAFNALTFCKTPKGDYVFRTDLISKDITTKGKEISIEELEKVKVDLMQEVLKL